MSQVGGDEKGRLKTAQGGIKNRQLDKISVTLDPVSYCTLGQHDTVGQLDHSIYYNMRIFNVYKSLLT